MEIHYNVQGCFRDPAADIQLAKRAVEAGFEGVWIGDHFLPWIDSRPYTHHVLPWLGSLMNEVPDVTVGTSVTCPLFRYQPPTLAQALATLDNMYPGRLELGVGTGEALNEAHFVESWPEWGTRAGMLVETIEVMRTLWASEDYVSYDGQYYDYDGMKLYTQATAPIDVHWAGWGPQSCELAGRHADGVLSVGPPEMFEEQILPNVADGLEDRDRSLEDLPVTTEFGANYGDPAALVTEIRERGEYLPHDTELDNPDPRDVQRVADDRLAAMSDEEIVEHATITDDPQDFVDAIEAYADAGVTRVLVGSQCGDPEATIEVFEEHVIPAVS